MHKIKINQNLIILLLITSINLFFAQKKEFRDTEVDTLTFLNNRKLLNSLNTDQFQKKIFVENDIQIPYRFLTPKNNRKNEKFPLVITFHNSTRIGNDNENQLEPFAKIWLRDEIYEKYVDVKTLLMDAIDMYFLSFCLKFYIFLLFYI
jgi:hypothetical protein